MIETGKRARKRGGTRADVKRANRQGNPSSYPVRHPNEQNEKARDSYWNKKRLA